MEVSNKYYDEIFHFKGPWDMPSSCGLKLISNPEVNYVIVTELYQDNPGTSVTYAGKSLLEQIVEQKQLNDKTIVYLECKPDTGSKLSFYNEEYFEVLFSENRPSYRKLDDQEIKELLSYSL